MAKQAVLELIADASKLKSTLSDAEGHTDKFSGSMGKLGGVIAGALTGAAVLKFGSDSVKAFTESEQAQSKLELALKNSSATVGAHASDFEKLNSALAKKTLADDDAIASGQAVLATFGATTAQIKTLTPTMVDLAAKMGVDMPAAADLIDKAAFGSVKALKTLGIEGYKPTGDKAQDLANVQGLLHDKVKGAAQAQLDAAGPGETMKKSMDELQETVGKHLVPALEKIAVAAVAVLDFFAAHPAATFMAAAIGTIAAAVWIATTASAAYTVVTGGLVTAFWALNTAMYANPIGLVIAAVVALIAAFVIAYKNSETFRDIVDGAFRAVKQVVGDVIGWILQYVDMYLHGFQLMAEAASHLPLVGDKFKGIAEAIGGVRSKVQGMAADAHRLGEEASYAASKLTDVQLAASRLRASLGNVGVIVSGASMPGLAAGGPVIPGGAYLVGENGPELFLPKTAGNIIPNGGVGGVGGGMGNTYQIAVTAIDPAAAQEAVIAAIREYERRNGTDWRAA